jgi:heme/copper-type cytochrome/quinol oxidase subunit 2
MRPTIRARNAVNLLLALGLVLAGGAVGFLATVVPNQPQEREITVRAYQYAYEPEVIRVNRGDTIRLRFIADDVVHGFYLEGHDLDVKIFPLEPQVELSRPSRPGVVEKVEEVVFVASREGKFRYRCSTTCGYMHPFMQGELIVAPNRLYSTSIGVGVGLLLGGLVLVARREGRA